MAPLDLTLSEIDIDIDIKHRIRKETGNRILETN